MGEVTGCIEGENVIIILVTLKLSRSLSQGAGYRIWLFDYWVS